jgi:hypothetical protein
MRVLPGAQRSEAVSRTLSKSPSLPRRPFKAVDSVCDIRPKEDVMELVLGKTAVENV